MIGLEKEPTYQLILDTMREGHLSDIAREVGRLGCPIAERRSKSMDCNAAALIVFSNASVPLLDRSRPFKSLAKSLAFQPFARDGLR